VRRLPVAAFAALMAATVAAFFITQHLKVSTPLIGGFPRPYPAVINPVDGVSCYDPVAKKEINHRLMTISFYLQNRSDSVNVYVVDAGGRIVATLARSRFMLGGGVPGSRAQFVWDGREPSGVFAPDGRYYVRVRLIHTARTVTISNSSGPATVTVNTLPPTPVVTSVTPRVVFRHARVPVKIQYAGNEGRGATVIIYRIGRHRRYQMVKSFLTPWRGQQTTWDGLIKRRPAPAGRYLVGLEVTDAACNTGHFPTKLPPPRGTAAQDVVTVRR
jgi:hypothetical protein